MRNVSKSLLVVAVIVIPAVLWAQSREELYESAKKAEAGADAKLNTAYEKLIKSIRANNSKELAENLIERLQKSQRAWLEFRDAQTDFVSHYHHPGYSYIRAAKIAGYRAELTEARTKELITVPDPN